MKPEKTRMREKGSGSFAIIAYGVTILCILLSLVPLAWALSSSLKDSISLFAVPPKWIPPQPQAVEIVLDYEEANLQDRAGLERDALKALWFAWKKHQNEPIGSIAVYGASEGRWIYTATMKSYEFHAGKNTILPTQLFTDQIMKAKHPVIMEKGFSHIVWHGAESDLSLPERSGSSGALANDIGAFLAGSDFLEGKPISIVQTGDWSRVFDNYVAVVKASTLYEGSTTVWTYLYNSAFVTAMSILSQLLLGGMTAYAITKMMSGKWSARFTLFFVATIFIPEIAVIVPLYLVIEKLNLTNNLWGVILPHTSWGLVIFIFKGFFEQIPDELLHAARIDGSGEWRIFRSVVVPMSIPVFTVVAVLTFMPVWNEFLWPLVVLRDDHLWTFSVFMNSRTDMFVSNHTMAMLLIATVPLVLVFATCQKLIEQGVRWSGVKG